MVLWTTRNDGQAYAPLASDSPSGQKQKGAYVRARFAQPRPRWLLAGLIALSTVLSLSGTAYATTSSSGWSTTFFSTTNCTNSKSTITDDNQPKAPRVLAEVESRFTVTLPGGMLWYCAGYFNRPAGYLANQYYLYHYDADFTHTWSLCTNSAFTTNSQNNASYASIGWDFGRSSLYVCGTGPYHVDGGGWVLNGQWYGGLVSSGDMWFSS